MCESRLIVINEDERNSTAVGIAAIFQSNHDETKHSALDRMLENVLPIRFAEVDEREVLLGNVSRIKKCCHKKRNTTSAFPGRRILSSGCRARILTSRLGRPFGL